MASLQKRDILNFCILGVGSSLLALRFYTSAAFERPFHFSIFTFLLTGGGLYFYGSKRAVQDPGDGPLFSLDPSARRPQLPAERMTSVTKALNQLMRLRTPSSPFALLVGALIGRTLLFWRLIRTIHCSWDGFSALLPLSLFVFEAISPRAGQLPRDRHATNRQSSAWTFAFFGYIVVAFVWAIGAIRASVLFERPTGAICPSGIWESMTPVELLVLGFDTLVIIHIGRTCQDSSLNYGHTWRLLASVFLTSSAILAFLSTFSFFEWKNLRWNFLMHGIVIRDLLIDGIVATAAILSGVYLLSRYHATILGLLVAGTATLTYELVEIANASMLQLWIAIPVVFVGLGLLLQFVRDAQPSRSSKSLPYRSGLLLYAILAGLLFCAVSMRPRAIAYRPINELISAASYGSREWIEAAGKSTTLDEAVVEYHQRYEIPPPPNFDKWYKYATKVKSPIIDSFDQIHRDLFPYWGLPPAEIRARTTHLLEHPGLFLGGLSIKDGKVEISPHVQGTHMWMMNGMKSMIEPFAKWLPEMQLVFNLDDECRVSVPYHDMQTLKDSASSARRRLRDQNNLLSYSKDLSPPWSLEYLDMDTQAIWKTGSYAFKKRSKSLTYYEYIATTCPSTSWSNVFRWWNRKEECALCKKPHTTEGFINDWNLAGDLCHQPDLAYHHGFLLAPASAIFTHSLFPIFSQGRMHNFADIIHPSPWNYVDKVEYDEARSIEWTDKLNTLFWRGAASDGYATHGAWQTFLRARFVNMVRNIFPSSSRFNTKPLFNRIHPGQRPATGKKSKKSKGSKGSSNEPLNLNVSFVGEFSRCDQRDCGLESQIFYGKSDPEEGKADFQEHWLHRHLMDMDGEGFSGRFVPFLESKSLPWRAALFRTWWEERVHAWRHFIPVDVRLSELGGLLEYFGRGGEGPKQAEEIAAAGSDWAAKALRKEDMEVYMFRLLLEWGRIIDDRREEIGFRL